MTYYKLIMSYKGTRFYGWQRQKGDRPTIQGHLEDCLGKIYKGAKSKTLASGRTDAGVHALAQMVALSAPWDIPCDDLKRALNSLLVPDIRIREVLPGESSFHPIRDSLWKEYCYLFSMDGKEQSPFFYEMFAHIGYNLDLSKMKRAAQAFEGNHDFCNYRTTGGSSKTTWKRIDESAIVSAEVLFPFMESRSLYVFRVRGEGFLKQMVRLMMGAIVEVGMGRASLEEIEKSLEGGPSKDRIGAVAPACGLYLREVFYKKS